MSENDSNEDTATATPSERYPHWCVDRGPEFGEEQYLGGYSEEAAALEAHVNGGEPRRYRRVKASEFLADLADQLLEEADDWARSGELPEGAWLNTDDIVVVAGLDFKKKFAAWLDEHVRVDAYVCEGDEGASS